MLGEGRRQKLSNVTFGSLENVKVEKPQLRKRALLVFSPNPRKKKKEKVILKNFP